MSAATVTLRPLSLVACVWVLALIHERDRVGGGS